MIIVNVKFESIEVAKYTREALTLNVNFDDGSKVRTIEKTTDLENVEALSEQIINEVRTKEKELNAVNSGDFLDDVVIIRIEDDERTIEKLNNAFRRVKEEMKKLQTANVADNYLQQVAMFQKLKFTL